MSFLRFVNGNTNATEEPMDGVQCVYFKGLWRIYGGWNSTGSLPYDRNSQYTSPDLITWTRQRDADWPPSHSFGLLHDEVNDILYKVGSDGQPDTTPTQRGDIWKSTDGLNWTLVSHQSFLENVVVFFSDIIGTDIYVGGGHILGGTQGAWTVSAASVNTKVWKSTDGGINFTEIATGITQIGGNIGNQIKWYPEIDKWVLACCPSKYDDEIANRVYSRNCYLADKEWTTVTADKIFPGAGRSYADICRHDGKLWMINGYIEGGSGANSAELWYRNKSDWAKIVAIPLTTTHATGIASDGTTLGIMCGNLNSQAYYLEQYNP